jgi:hypothetical protein
LHLPLLLTGAQVKIVYHQLTHTPDRNQEDGNDDGTADDTNDAESENSAFSPSL